MRGRGVVGAALRGGAGALRTPAPPVDLVDDTSFRRVRRG